MVTDIEKLFLALVRGGIGNSKEDSFQFILDWKDMMVLANAQGLSAVVLDGVNEWKSRREEGWCGCLPPQQFVLQWIGNVMQNYEARYVEYEKALGSLAGWYNAHGYKMMVLKGYACSIDWPKPEHRPCGDIDIWLFGKQNIADELLAKETGILLDKSHHHHTVFSWGDFMVENHYDFINVHHHRSNGEMDKILKELGGDDTHYVEVLGERVYLPSPNLHALFLLRHSMSHFASERITLRHLLDWAFFVKKHGKEVDWVWLIGILERFGMRRLFDIFNAICIEDLGFESYIFPPLTKVDGSIKNRVLSEILSPEFNETEPNTFLPRVLFKYRRWCANEWKHQLCYKESMWSAFWSGMWSHLQKPHSI